MQETQGFGESRQIEAGVGLGRQGFTKIRRLHGTVDELAQAHLRQARRRRIHRGEPFRQRRVGRHRLAARMHHFQAEEAAARLAGDAHEAARLQRLDLAGIEVEEAQDEFAAVVGNRGHQLAARPLAHFAVDHPGLHHRRPAGREVAYGGEAGFVFPAQRQVQREVDVGKQPQFLQPGFDRRRNGEGKTHRYKTSTPSASMRAPRGRLATPTAARAGYGSRKYWPMISLTLAKWARSVR